MPFSKEIKSNRILQGRRYTQALTDGNEAFTQVLDLSANEIYSQQNLLPTSSLPYSGSSQDGQTITVNGQTILKYWYRLQLTPGPSSGGLSSAWFMISPPTASAITNQVIQPGQLTNFVSNKYITPAKANQTAETAGDVGYTVVLRDSTGTVTDQDFQFDYKMGVLNFEGVGKSTSNPLYLTAYQYIGKTLASDATLGYSGSFSGSFQGSATLNNLTLTGSFNHTGSYNLIGNITQTGSLNQSGSINVVGPIISNGINVVDNAIAMAIALG
jgi:hypothetical protein